MEAQFELDKKQSTADQVYVYLRRQILNLSLKPGVSLSKVELATFFNVSATPIRDAILRLAEEGLVDVFPQHGTRVSAIDIDSAKYAHFLRLSLEVEIARRLAVAGAPKLIQELGSVVDNLRFSLSQENFDAFIELDFEFHRRLFVAAEVEDLWQLICSKSGNIDRLRRLHLSLNGKAADILQDHLDLIAAISQHNAYAAEAVVRRNLSGTLSRLRALREFYPGLLMPESA